MSGTRFRLLLTAVALILCTACSGSSSDGAVAEPVAPATSEAVPTEAPTADSTPSVPESTAVSEEPAAVEATPDAVDAESSEQPEEEPTAGVASPAAEDVQVCDLVVTVAFRESAPRDRMTISNESAGDTSLASVEFDLTSSVGEVIFDTLDGGAGVEVFQDFQVEGGEAALAYDPLAEDGASVLELDFDQFAPGQSFVFSIDVDDQLTNSDLGQIQVSGAELAGAMVNLTTATGDQATAVFDANDVAAYAADC